jgi:hypothetical protein
MEIQRTSNGIFIHQTKYTEQILQKFAGRVGEQKRSTPAEKGLDLVESEKADPSYPYLSIVGSLMYLATVSRPDIAHSVHWLCRFMSAPLVKHCNACERVLMYLRGSTNLGITYLRTNTDEVVAFSDADFAGDAQARSTTGTIHYLSWGPVAWESRLQTVTASSTAEAEYIALHSCGQEIMWLKQFLQQLQCRIPTVIVFEDNRSCIAIAKTRAMSRRIRHFHIAWHATRDLVENLTIEVRYVPTREEVADILTKALPYPIFKHLRAVVLGGQVTEAFVKTLKLRKQA